MPDDGDCISTDSDLHEEARYSSKQLERRIHDKYQLICAPYDSARERELLLIQKCEALSRNTRKLWNDYERTMVQGGPRLIFKPKKTLPEMVISKVKKLIGKKKNSTVDDVKNLRDRVVAQDKALQALIARLELVTFERRAEQIRVQVETKYLEMIECLWYEEWIRLECMPALTAKEYVYGRKSGIMQFSRINRDYWC